MEESNNIIREIGNCLCLKPAYKHFIMVSLEESIQKREGYIDIAEKSGEETEKIKGLISVHKLTKEELTKVRNMVHSIPSC